MHTDSITAHFQVVMESSEKACNESGFGIILRPGEIAAVGMRHAVFGSAVYQRASVKHMVAVE